MIEVVPSALPSENVARYVVARMLASQTGMACVVPCPPRFARPLAVSGSKYCNPVWHLDGNWPRLAELNTPLRSFPLLLDKAKVRVCGSFAHTPVFENRDQIRGDFFLPIEPNGKRIVLVTTRQSRTAALIGTAFPSPDELAQMIPSERSRICVLVPPAHAPTVGQYQKRGFQCEVVSPETSLAVAAGATEIWASKVPLHWWAATLSHARKINVFSRSFRPPICKRLRQSAQMGEYKIHYAMPEATLVL